MPRETMPSMDRDAVDRVESKLDALLDRVERLQQAVDGLGPRQRLPRRPIAHDPDVQRRFEERIAHIRASGQLEQWEQKMREQDRQKGDPDWWLRSALDRMDRSDPIS